MKTTTATESETTTIVPFPLAALRALPGGKDLLLGVVDTAAGLIAGHAVHLLAAHPGARRGDVAALAHQLWGSVRGLEYGDARGWHVERAIAEAVRSPLEELNHVLLVLLGAGDVRTTLLRQRDALDEQIQALDAAAARGSR